MFDANGVICTDIHKAYLELLSSDQILKTSVCRVTSPVVFDGDQPHAGGLHDPAMGSLDTRQPCITCGLRRDCPGHLGHIELPLLVFHPTLLSSLVRLLKAVCFRCRRLKLDFKTASVYIKKFQLVQKGLLADIERFDLLHGKSSADRFSRTTKGSSEKTAPSLSQSNAEAKRVQLVQLLTKLQTQQKSGTVERCSLPLDISETHTAVETWNYVRKECLRVAASRASCAHCSRVFKTSLKQAPSGNGIDMTWPWGTEKPFSRSTWLQETLDKTGVSRAASSTSKKRCENADAPQCSSAARSSNDEGSDIENDEENMIHGRRGRVLGYMHFQPYQLINLLQALWSSRDSTLLEFLYPMSIKNGWEIFFIRYLPVSANRFRPLTQGENHGGANQQRGSSQQGILHIRTSALLDILQVSEKMSFALKVLQHSNPLEALTDPSFAQDIRGAPLSSITEVEKSKLTKSIMEHKGNFKLLNTYSKELQQCVNQYIDSSKTVAQRGKRPPPGVRQWMERKQGAIRQKMMGKRVNFAARTVIAPDNCINTNEIGIPIEFAKKLTIPEHVTPQSSAYLQQLVENGAHCYPGANMIQDGSGFVYDLAVMSDAQRRAKARLLFSDDSRDGAPKIVYRHLRDGDVVIMNRQPTLHRASMMAHFIRVLPGWKTFRLMYVNCGSYNADFDGDEMNMHLPQDHTSRAEAQSIVNADCQYITAKNGEPLRGLIQDHVLGGTFLTCRNTFLTVNEYYTLLYVGLASFVDRGQRLRLSATGDAQLEAASQLYCPTNTGSGLNSILAKFEQFSNTNIRIFTEPPALVKPKKLWTGKQVITSILKTVVDTIARCQYAKDMEFQKTYRGLNFTAQSKTPGDAWGGVLDGDTEESTLVIRESELLQGVFDKSMFGASSFGLVHLCFELLGPSTAGLLLSIFAKTFTCYLQLRGFSCCTGDFLMTPEGERNRNLMIERCTLAGNYLQEVLIDSMERDMGWSDQLVNNRSRREKLEAVHKAILKQQTKNKSRKSSALTNTPDAVQHFLASTEVDRRLDIDGFLRPAQGACKEEQTAAPSETVYGLDYSAAVAASRLRSESLCELPPSIKEDVNLWNAWKKGDESVEELKASLGTKHSENKEMLLAASKNSSGETNPSVNLWGVSRYLHCPIVDWRTQSTPQEIISAAERLVNWITTVGTSNHRLERTVLAELAKTPELAVYFPRVAQLVGAQRLWKCPVASASQKVLTLTEASRAVLPPQRVAGSAFCIPPPPANASCRLLSGRVVSGDGSFRVPRLYHPSWLYMDKMGLEFEDTKRYIGTVLGAPNILASTNYNIRSFSLRPNELTRYRLECLAKAHFVGRESALTRIADGFFQAGLGKLTSKNNDLVSGNVTLYKFPQNGFASMITTGAKGSKVNFAMICGMLSQQSLEGRRVPVMVSAKTLPSFSRYDFGARAGGLITDRYLTGLRPQEYFFHCMAGREGLVDTAVKTARSGYLQRCVMKGMEGVMVQYDGTVRDSDGTIVQFLYGEDGVDVSKASYSKRLDDLLQNPAILRAKYGSETKLHHPSVKHSFRAIEHWVKHSRSTCSSAAQELKNQSPPLFAQPEDPLSNIFPPVSCVGSTSEKYREQVEHIVKQDTHRFVSDTIMAMRLLKQNRRSNDSPTEEERRLAQQRLKQLLLVKFSETLCAPGEAVGCISAQSMGEPATQMTLNTFHLAGHGAANVTLGIPRLREILQTAGNTKTPMIYIPLNGSTRDEAAKNAETVLLGFKRIPLSDVIHAVGVESNVYYKHENVQPGNSLPEYDLQRYRSTVDQAHSPKFFWEYETTIQFENLDHFCNVVPRFTPQHIVVLTLNRIVRDMAKQVSKLVYLYASKYADEEVDSEEDELDVAATRFVFDRDIRSHFTRRDLRKERARVAGVGFGKSAASGVSAAAMDLMTNIDVTEALKRPTERGNDGDDEGEGLKDDDGSIKRQVKSSQQDDATDDSDTSSDDSEQDFSSSEKGEDGNTDHDTEDEDDGGQEAEADDASSSGDDEASTTDDESGRKSIAAKSKNAGRHILENLDAAEYGPWKKKMKTRWKNLQLDMFDQQLGVLKTDHVAELEGEPLEDEAMWCAVGRRATKLKSLPDEAFRFLTDIQVSRQKWNIVVKFGWPMERCPRRVVLLNHFVNIIKRYTLQDTPGVRNPRIVGGDHTETKAPFEVQCEGSNFGWIFRLKASCVDHSRITTNDIRTVLHFFGVEACRLVIIRELNKVFSVYGITVDYRHMSLIADAMTHSGCFRPFNRLGIQHHSSPLLQMSFETSMKFLTEAIERGACDNLRTPAGAIVTGKPATVGTGMCRVLPRIQLSRKRRSNTTKVSTPITSPSLRSSFALDPSYEPHPTTATDSSFCTKKEECFSVKQEQDDPVGHPSVTKKRKTKQKKTDLVKKPKFTFH